MMKAIRKLLPHVCISLCLGLAVIAVLDGFNPMMAFLTSRPSKIFLFCCCAAGILCGVECVRCQRRLSRRRRPSETGSAAAPGDER